MLALIVAVTVPDTFLCVMVKVAVCCPAATITVLGTVASKVELVKVTTVPPAGVGPVSVTVPVTLVLMFDTLVGERIKLATVGDWTLTVVD
jgi:hypothetical protein